MILDIPYFMTNNKWFYFDKYEKKYKLTNDATDKAIKSYNEFFKEVEKWNVNKGIR